MQKPEQIMWHDGFRARFLMARPKAIGTSWRWVFQERRFDEQTWQEIEPTQRLIQIAAGVSSCRTHTYDRVGLFCLHCGSPRPN